MQVVQKGGREVSWCLPRVPASSALAVSAYSPCHTLPLSYLTDMTLDHKPYATSAKHQLILTCHIERDQILPDIHSQVCNTAEQLVGVYKSMAPRQ